MAASLFNERRNFFYQRNGQHILGRQRGEFEYIFFDRRTYVRMCLVLTFSVAKCQSMACRIIIIHIEA